MTTLEARVATPHGSETMQKLCKHWSHKFAVTYDPAAGRVPFGEGGVCDLRADAAGLDMRVTAPDEETAAKLGEVVVTHLRRFAFREDLGEIFWRAA